MDKQKDLICTFCTKKAKPHELEMLDEVDMITLPVQEGYRFAHPECKLRACEIQSTIAHGSG